MEPNSTKPAKPASSQKPPAGAKPQDKAPEEEKEHHEKLNPVDDFIGKIRHSIKKLPMLEKADEMFYSGVKVVAGLGIQNILDYKVEGKDNIPIVGKAILVTIADNVIFDMAAVMHLSERPVHFMLSAKMFKTPVLGSVLDGLGMYRSTIDKDDMEPVQKTMHYLNEEAALVAMTPEEKLEPEVQVKTLASIIKFAIAGGAPIIPVAIHGTKSLGWKKPLLIKVGTPIPIPAELNREKKRDERYAKAKEIVDLIHSMKESLSTEEALHKITIGNEKKEAKPPV
jgi:1-acyl-sn-glycerol-3-phosphate acyltransferase